MPPMKILVALALALSATSAARAQSQVNAGPGGPVNGNSYGAPYSGAAINNQNFYARPRHHSSNGQSRQNGREQSASGDLGFFPLARQASTPQH
jgi:nicotinamide mononucleotide (NMN) deamidase PncC